MPARSLAAKAMRQEIVEPMIALATASTVVETVGR